jgi:argininosuccinate lyase
MATEAREADRRTELWQDLGRIVTAHVVMLRDAAILDDAALAAVLTPIDGVARGRPDGETPSELTAAFDERVDALAAPGTVGAAAIGRGRTETAATAARLAIRRDLLRLAASADEVRRATIELASLHAATIMPAYLGGQPAQPTTFGHFLGGLIGPLARASRRLTGAYDEVNRSPLGAVALASTALPIERERSAALLGFAGLIESTFDAVAACDHVAPAAQAAGAVASAIRRFLAEVLIWLRTEPDSFRLGDEWLATDPALPQLRAPVGIERLVSLARQVESQAAVAAELAAEAGYGPIVAGLDPLFDAGRSAIQDASRLASRFSALLSGGLEVNRAYLANRAGRAYTTASDLATFLMTEERLDPATAANVAALTISRARAEGVEISGVTPQIIDAAALLVVGRELGVEFEAISRHLAPRRFLERRTATGGPAPASVTSYLDEERRRLDADVRWRLEAEARLASAARELERLTTEALAQAE